MANFPKTRFRNYKRAYKAFYDMWSNVTTISARHINVLPEKEREDAIEIVKKIHDHLEKVYVDCLPPINIEKIGERK